MKKFLAVYETYCSNEPCPVTRVTEKEQEILDDDDLDYTGIYEAPQKYGTDRERELKEYVQSTRAPSDTNILQWWSVNASVFPKISKMTKDFLSIPATSVPSKRVSSEGGSVAKSLPAVYLRKKSALSYALISLKKEICEVDL